MSFQPIIPMSGYAGWRFLDRTIDTQMAAFVEAPAVRRSTDYFAEKISSIRTAADLVNDRRLLDVALGAFGLDGDIDSRAFIQRVLEEGTLSNDALANRLSDKRYRQFAKAFGFGDLGPRTGLPNFANEIIDRYETKRFELAVGNQSGDMRLALSLGAGLSDILGQVLSEEAQWFSMMGNPPLRRVFETALGLPASFGQVNLDQQLDVFRERARSTFGIDRFSDLSDPAIEETVIRLFLVRSEGATSGAMSGGSVALSLLQSSQLSYG